MTAKIVLSVYVDVEKDNEEVSAMVSDLVGRLGGNVVTKPKKQRKPRRPMTDEEKAAFRARMVAGREAKAKAKAKEDADIDAKAETDLDKKTALAGTEPVKTVKSTAKKTTSKVSPPVPRTGRKVKSKPPATK